MAALGKLSELLSETSEKVRYSPILDRRMFCRGTFCSTKDTMMSIVTISRGDRFTSLRIPSKQRMDRQARL
jgi:hypothetical protein